MTPVLLASEIFQVLFQESSHVDYAVCHPLDFSKPLLLEVGIVQNLCGYACAMYGRVGVERPNKNLDLRIDSLLLLS